MFSIWIFGRIWCSIWLAVDVWTCTASILHLVVISLDRYIAVTHPITYPNIMTSKRAKMLILAAWVLREFNRFTKWCSMGFRFRVMPYGFSQTVCQMTIKASNL